MPSSVPIVRVWTLSGVKLSEYQLQHDYLRSNEHGKKSFRTNKTNLSPEHETTEKKLTRMNAVAYRERDEKIKIHNNTKR